MSATQSRDTSATASIWLRDDVFDDLTAKLGASNESERAKAAGIDRTTLWRWRERRFVPSLDQAMRVADRLGTTVDELFEAVA